MVKVENIPYTPVTMGSVCQRVGSGAFNYWEFSQHFILFFHFVFVSHVFLQAVINQFVNTSSTIKNITVSSIGSVYRVVLQVWLFNLS